MPFQHRGYGNAGVENQNKLVSLSQTLILHLIVSFSQISKVQNTLHRTFSIISTKPAYE